MKFHCPDGSIGWSCRGRPGQAMYRCLQLPVRAAAGSVWSSRLSNWNSAQSNGSPVVSVPDWWRFNVFVCHQRNLWTSIKMKIVQLQRSSLLGTPDPPCLAIQAALSNSAVCACNPKSKCLSWNFIFYVPSRLHCKGLYHGRLPVLPLWYLWPSSYSVPRTTTYLPRYPCYFSSLYCNY